MNPTSGKDFIWAVQRVGNTTGALVPAHQTEGSFSSENELIDEQTKQGRVLGYANKTQSIELTYYFERGDEGHDEIKQADANQEEIRVWRIDKVQNGNTAYDALFAYGLIESREESDATDGFIEVSVTVQVSGVAQEGELTTLPAGAENASQYSFEEPETTP